MSLLQLFDPNLLGRRDRPALEFRDADGLVHASAFGDIEARSNRLANALASRGLRAGDRLAIHLPNQPAFIDLWLACLKLGVIFVPINVLYREREIRHIVTDASPVAVVTAEEVAEHVPRDATRWDVHGLQSDAEPCGDDRPAALVTADTPAALVYTSGTTGASKGAILTHRNFAANTVTLLACWGITHEDRYLAALPLFHVHGLGNGLHCWLASGCHMRLVPRFEHARAVDDFEHYRPTLFFGVPTMYVRLLEVDAERARRIGERTRLFVSGSAALPPRVLDAFAARYGHVILERYGMTETLMIASNLLAGERRPGTVGHALPMLSLRVVDDSGRDVPPETPGEVWVRGPNVFPGYWRREDATASAFVDGWFRTGDIGVLAGDGRLTLRGRRSELIISGGFNIYPREIEELLLVVPGVREAAVVGVEDELRGEVPVAYVVCEGDIDRQQLSEYLATRLASFKHPRAIVTVDALPRNAMGKVQKHLLPPWRG